MKEMALAPAEVLEGLKSYDTPTVFNAIHRLKACSDENYTDHTIRCLLPDLGVVLGYAVTIEVTTNDEGYPSVPWVDHYRSIDDIPGPVMVVFRDVDSRSGRGASFGEGMTLYHKHFGTVGALFEGTIRDLKEIHREKFPVFAKGTTPGHGEFHPTRLNVPVTVGQMRVCPGDLVMGDINGCVRIPVDRAEDILKECAEIIKFEQSVFKQIPGGTIDQLAKAFNWEK